MRQQAVRLRLEVIDDSDRRLAFNNHRPKEEPGERSIGGDKINVDSLEMMPEKTLEIVQKSQILTKFEETYLLDVAKLILQVEDKSDNRT
ncbi:hypothetical protein SLA2020_429100 [Shorea laevis]